MIPSIAFLVPTSFSSPILQSEVLNDVWYYNFVESKVRRRAMARTLFSGRRMYARIRVPGLRDSVAAGGHKIIQPTTSTIQIVTS